MGYTEDVQELTPEQRRQVKIAVHDSEYGSKFNLPICTVFENLILAIEGKPQKLVVKNGLKIGPIDEADEGKGSTRQAQSSCKKVGIFVAVCYWPDSLIKPVNA